MELEALRDQVTTTLCQLKWEGLVEVCNFLKCSDITEEDESRSRRRLMKVIERTLDGVEQSNLPEEAAQFIRELLSFIGGKGATGDPLDRPECFRLFEMREKYDELRGEVKALGEKLKITDAAPSSVPNQLPPKVPEVTIRREFRICGQIGEGGQRDRLSYTNLLHQMENGLRKGHSESEIIEAVIRAISPGLKLRDMLEIKSDLTLSQLKTILKGHYREDDTSDLYQKLININQGPKESAQDFLFRAIELKDRLLYASRGKEEEHYSAHLVKKKFLRTVDTGLLNDNIKFQIKPFLDNPDVADETLIERLNEAANLEAERLNKLKRNSTKPPKINELLTPNEPRGSSQVPPVQHPAPAKENTKVAPAPPEMHALVKELKTEVAEVKQMVLATLNTRKSQTFKRTADGVGSWRRKGCRACQNNGEGDCCTHCFKCGQAGHISRGCRASHLLQGNIEGPLPWDQQ
ncbi:uncharacterized protein LOC114427792 [Parambassis ranga]|uniref:Uncharacterized protein LOC114427792 n=1 Tax=Parambassis ranga TaxID=210632 RepID=A0A6P7H931_9TELE|nr:uncharacterized protein LOC114427792 [Parambassis ranga]